MLQLQSQILPAVVSCKSHKENKLSTAEPRMWPLESLLPTVTQYPRRTQLDFQAQGWVYLGSSATVQWWMLYNKKQGQVCQQGKHYIQLCRVRIYYSREEKVKLAKDCFPRSTYMFPTDKWKPCSHFYSPLWKYNVCFQLFWFISDDEKGII